MCDKSDVVHDTRIEIYLHHHGKFSESAGCRMKSLLTGKNKIILWGVAPPHPSPPPPPTSHTPVALALSVVTLIFLP